MKPDDKQSPQVIFSAIKGASVKRMKVTDDSNGHEKAEIEFDNGAILTIIADNVYQYDVTPTLDISVSTPASNDTWME